MAAIDWRNILSVYMQRNAEYKVANYIDEFHPTAMNDFTLMDDFGRKYDPTYIVHEVIRCLTERLYTHYRETIDEQAEAELASIIHINLVEARPIV